MKASRQIRLKMPLHGADDRGRALVVGVTAAILIALVAVASRPVAPPGDVAAARPGPILALVHVIEILGIALELLAILVLVVIVRPRWRRRPDDEPEEYHEPFRAPWWLKALVVAVPLLTIGAIVYIIVNLRKGAPPPQLFEFGPPPASGSDFADRATAALGLGWWEYAVAAALAAVAFAIIVRALRRPPATGGAKAAPAERARILSEAVGAGLFDAQREHDPRRAVIAAYATMERTLADRGLPRNDHEAPLEYMSRLFAELDIGQNAIRTLTHLFEVARFSHHEIAPAAKAQAILALVDLREELRASP